MEALSKVSCDGDFYEFMKFVCYGWVYHELAGILEIISNLFDAMENRDIHPLDQRTNEPGAMVVDHYRRILAGSHEDKHAFRLPILRLCAHEPLSFVVVQ